MQIKKIDHACFIIDVDGVKFVTDPFSLDIDLAIKQNPDLVNPDYILISHGHNDHMGSLSKIAGDKTTIISNFEIASYLTRKGYKTIDMNIGGEIALGEVLLAMTPAVHTSSIADEDSLAYGGLASGFIIKHKSNTLYFAGDTDLFLDMKLIDKIYHPNIGLLPVGGHYTMNVDKAIYACKKFFKFKYVFPMHFNTFPAIECDPNLNLKRSKTIILKNGESYEI